MVQKRNQSLNKSQILCCQYQKVPQQRYTISTKYNNIISNLLLQCKFQGGSSKCTLFNDQSFQKRVAQPPKNVIPLKYHQQPENKQYIEKIYKNFKKRNNDQFIKLTQLGELNINQSQSGQRIPILTKPQLQQLDIIEMNRKYGSMKKLSPANIIKQEKEGKQNNYDKMLKSSFNIVECRKEISQNMQWGDLKDCNTKLQNNKNKCKFQHFHKRLTQKKKRSSKRQSTKISLQKHKQKLQSGIQQFSKSKIRNLIETYPSGIVQQQTKQQQIQKLEENILNKLKDKNSIYYTKQRIQALYQCEFLRGIKKILGNKRYYALQIGFNKQNARESSISQEKCEQNLKQKQFFSEATEVLKKNYHRIKQQRKRIIQKLRT